MMHFIYPPWSALANVNALTTTRQGGQSLPPYDSFNLGHHVGDDPQHVAQNRQQLIKTAQLPSSPIWFQQVHGTQVVQLDGSVMNDTEADAVYTRQAGQVCAMMTADCLPVVFCSKQGNEVAVAHAGWRGLCHGILENTLAMFQAPIADILVWLGPAIGPSQFEVGEEVRAAFMAYQLQASEAFQRQRSGKYLANIYLLAKQRLAAMHIAPSHISGGIHCTMTEKEYFFSYRREGQTGRMATLAWFEDITKS